MLRRWHIDVVAFGPSLHDAESYFLIRAFPSLENRQEREDAFYGSDEWKRGPREAILADIASYTTVVVMLDEVSVHNIRTTVGWKPKAAGAETTTSAAPAGTGARIP